MCFHLKNKLEKLDKKKSGLIIHHWDTDGLACGGMLYSYFRDLNPKIELELITPKIGNYFLTKTELAGIKKKKYDFLVTADINFPPDVVDEIKKVNDDIYIFDHHHQKKIHGVHYVNEKYPGCTWVLNEYLKLDPCLLGILGMVGDKEEKILEDDHYASIINEVVKENNLTFNDLLLMRRYIDSLYMVQDYKNIKNIAKLLADAPKEVLHDENLEKNIQKIDKELTKYLELKPNDIGNNIFEYELKSKYHIISHTTRGLSRKYPENIIFIYQERGDIVNTYIRRRELDVNMEKIVDFAKKKKYSSGGKAEVAGIICPKKDWPDFKQELVRRLALLAGNKEPESPDEGKK